MKSIKLSMRTISGVADVICGGAVGPDAVPISPYRTYAALEEFFVDDLGFQHLRSIPADSRTKWTRECLKVVNGTPGMHAVLSACGRPVDFHGTKYTPGEVAKYLNDLLVHDGLRLVEGRSGFAVVPTTGPQVETDDTSVLSGDYIASLDEKCEERLRSGDFEGAISVARTFLEAVLGDLEEKLTGERADHKGDLPRQFKVVAKALKMDDKLPELDDRLKDLVRGLVTVANAIAPLRNGMSDAHPRKRAPAKPHARLMVNSAKTVATFLADSYAFQTHRPAKSSGKGAVRP